MHIIGASGHSKVVLDILQENGSIISGVWDDNPAVLDVLGFEISGNIAAFKKYNYNDVIVAIGNNAIRKKVIDSFNTISFAKAIHSRSFVSKNADIGDGTVIMAGVSINAGVFIGKHVIVNTNSSIDHDCKIHDFAHISPNAALAGNVTIGEGTHIGIGSAVIQGLTIGKWAVIGAGSVIISNVPDYCVVVGNPGKIIKYNIPNTK
ncbi:acetyltransferase [Pedobacter polysacchareus]|uniref:acetyltransferase n=1 Tax=Pedobacter polysacchareus TaxID=2861973 RepID=UPI001C999F75|nr:acetyltransferase [Pedobacter polysacchareus]